MLYVYADRAARGIDSDSEINSDERAESDIITETRFCDSAQIQEGLKLIGHILERKYFSMKHGEDARRVQRDAHIANLAKIGLSGDIL